MPGAARRPGWYTMGTPIGTPGIAWNGMQSETCRRQPVSASASHHRVSVISCCVYFLGQRTKGRMASTWAEVYIRFVTRFVMVTVPPSLKTGPCNKHGTIAPSSNGNSSFHGPADDATLEREGKREAVWKESGGSCWKPGAVWPQWPNVVIVPADVRMGHPTIMTVPLMPPEIMHGSLLVPCDVVLPHVHLHAATACWS